MYNYVKPEYTKEHLEELGGMEANAEWLDLHYQVIYAKYIYYVGTSLGFTPMSDESYDHMESRYKELCMQMGKKPTASDMVGWKANPILEALAMRQYDRPLYEKIKNNMFKFREG